MAIRITKVYTKSGDKGETSLVGGQRVPKESMRIEAYGTIDELNAVVGVSRVASASQKDGEVVARVENELQRVQQTLFNLGSELACLPADLVPGMPVVTDEDVAHLEHCMDDWTPTLPTLKSFILPGGGPVHAQLHVCRTVCRRAERVVLRLAREEQVRPEGIRYLNRLSDFFFVMGRWVGQQYGEPEFLWQSALQSKGSKAAQEAAKKRK